MQPLNQITIKAPATSANLGPGFDVFGLAIEKPSDKVTLTRTASSGVRIQISGLSADTISPIPERNTAGVVAMQMIKEFDLNTGLVIRIEKGIWPGRGLGSSAAPAAAVACGIKQKCLTST
jgi:homoserine kinase